MGPVSQGEVASATNGVIDKGGDGRGPISLRPTLGRGDSPRKDICHLHERGLHLRR